MMERILKHVRFTYDDPTKWLTIHRDSLGLGVTRTEMFSLARFILRIAQKGKRRKS